MDKFLHSGYYQPVNQQTLQSHLNDIDTNPELSARLENIIRQVGEGGSNVGNLSMENSSADPNNPQFGPGTVLPQYGGWLGLYADIPGSSAEWLTSKLNPYNTKAAGDYIGGGEAPGSMQSAFRNYYKRMMPAGTEPWLTPPQR